MICEDELDADEFVKVLLELLAVDEDGCNEGDDEADEEPWAFSSFMLLLSFSDLDDENEEEDDVDDELFSSSCLTICLVL